MNRLDIVFYYNNRRDLPAFEVFYNIAINSSSYLLISKYNAFDIDVYLLFDTLESNIIALDWDNTISSDISLYQQLIKNWRQIGFEPVVCSLREDDEDNRQEMHQRLGDTSIPLHLTNGKPKLEFMKEQSLPVHLWIDDFFPGICEFDNPLIHNNKVNN